jgi:GrpB-like predicted nucleotidyltransferase (UPF0157 family)
VSVPGDVAPRLLTRVDHCQDVNALPRPQPDVASIVGRAVVIVPYDPAWPRRFHGERDRIRSALGTVASRIEHVGSTSVPGLAVKPVVDIQLSVPKLADRDSSLPALERLGYRHRGDWVADHEFLKLHDAGVRICNLHVCEAGSRWERDHLAFRDRLRADPALAEAYATRKAELARRFPEDRYRYTEEKSEFIRSVVDA